MTPRKLWQPSPQQIASSNLKRYREWLRENYQLTFPDYRRLWEWSVEEAPHFWESVWHFFEVHSHTPYSEVRSAEPMPDTQWFSGATLNYAEHIFRQRSDERPAILFQSERQLLLAISWAELEEQVAILQAYLREQGVGVGDRVVAYLPNMPGATVAFLAVNSLGAVWSSCSPDFGTNSVVERFQQIEPKVLITVDGYQYNGKPFDRRDEVANIVEQLPSLERVLLIPYLNSDIEASDLPKATLWQEAMTRDVTDLTFTAVPFGHPIWVLYSSGTTGKPKAITHSVGGTLLEHLKYLAFHNDVRPGERFFWFSTTGWMMWNFTQAALLMGASIVLYDGSPGYPDLNVLWEMSQQSGLHHFGTSAPFLIACTRKGLQPGTSFDLSALRSIGSTGSPLPSEAFDWCYQSIKSDLWVCSMSGGTDVCTAFVGGCPERPVYEGEIQCRALGCALYAWNEEGQPVAESVGEMVITQPMPSMPIFFWNDPDKARYRGSYFDYFPGVWRHGDWVEITARDGLVIHGRSDATLNRQGVRIGTAEVYSALQKIDAVVDSLVVCLDLAGGAQYMPLFVKLTENSDLDEALSTAIKRQLRNDYSPRHVPDEIIAVPDIPYTLSGKKLEMPVKKILLGQSVDQAANRGAMRNPSSLDFFVTFAQKMGGR